MAMFFRDPISGASSLPLQNINGAKGPGNHMMFTLQDQAAAMFEKYAAKNENTSQEHVQVKRSFR